MPKVRRSRGTWRSKVLSFLKLSRQSSKSRWRDPNLGHAGSFEACRESEVLEPTLVLQPVGDRHLPSVFDPFKGTLLQGD